MNKLDEFTKQFTDKPIDNVVKIKREYFQVEEEILNKIKDTNKEIFSVGLFLGEEKDYFKPSLALIDLLSKKSEKKAYINKKGEWLFLCKRTILEGNIVKSNISQGMVLVQNEKDENLGYGSIQRQGRQIILKPILDRGDFLRREK
ncbi:MAG: hypothetical protein ABIC91_03135 [Nanoarchaeota archaeon]|nr:hypothetical protein [Nanoarchaeota archaeon]MBU1030081.1 hypothetical protein [Nanoarchaeota archaeon]MBU1850369.1 hypothetical protein [Nanoarchaeota archaeon]